MSHKVKSIIVAVREDALSDITQVADDLKAHGMTVSQVMPLTGMIVGSSDEKKIPELKKVEGVLGVEEEYIAQLPESEGE